MQRSGGILAADAEEKLPKSPAAERDGLNVHGRVQYMLAMIKGE